jgi:hypothetical protein
MGSSKGRRLPVFALLLSGTLLAAAPAGAAAAGAGGGEIVPGKGVGDLKVGMSLGDLLKRWGQAERTERDLEGVTLYDYGETRGVGVFVAGDRISQILVVTPDWSTTNGIKVGATRPEVLAFYGRPDVQLTGQAQDEVRFWYKQRGIVFIFKDRTVAGIAVLGTDVPEAPKELDPNDPDYRKPYLPPPGPSPLTR